MAPPSPSVKSSADYRQEYSAFIANLKAFHDKRGTILDPEPRVNQRPIDLFQLFNAVVSREGYDKVCAEKLAWRKLSTNEFNLGSASLPTTAYQLKSIYYKNLAAYEISTVHGREPPPKEILEDVSAKGGNILNRTVDNFLPTSRNTGSSALQDGMSGESGDDGTPVRDRPESEETPGSGGRATRGLRQAPPQRVLYQPDTLPARTIHRHSNTPSNSATTSIGSHTTRSASITHNPTMDPMLPSLETYLPRPPHPMTTRPVTTPANDPQGFAKKQRLEEQEADPKPVPSPRVMLPGTGFDGPNIYVRCLLALKSGIPAEQDYALHHLVKISMERGDKYRFESFPGLAEALIEKMLEVSSLFYEVDWEISYLDDGRMHGTHTLNGLEGTADILERIASLVQRDVDDSIQTEEFGERLLQINEAALTLRNMVMLEENALYVAGLFPLRDFLSIALTLPNFESVVELKHYCLDIAEQLTKYLKFEPVDPLYLSLLAQLQGEDRGAILTALRAISRISMNLEESNRLPGVPTATVQKIMDWVLLDDEELVHASLDFLYQYTAVVENVDLMISQLPVDALVNQLSRLLMYGAKRVETQIILKAEERLSGPDVVPLVPDELLQNILQLEEPNRSAQWLLCVFEEDKDESITQIALWHAYQAQFNANIEPSRPLLPAAEFIKNVSTAFADKATAQVQPASEGNKFIIKGIRIREAPTDMHGREYIKCRWTTALVAGPNNTIGEGTSKGCNKFFMSAEQIYNHILNDHVRMPKNAEGKFENKEMRFGCLWKGCQKYPKPTTIQAKLAGAHVKIHAKAAITATSTSAEGSGPKKAKASWIVPAVTQTVTFRDTAVDERGDAAGIPLSAVLVLRNLARNLPKTESEGIAMKEPGAVSQVEQLFKPMRPSLFEVFGNNRSLKNYLVDLLMAITS